MGCQEPQAIEKELVQGKITGFSFLEDYKLLLTFEEGTKTILDVEPYLHNGVFRPLRDPAYFRQARLEANTIRWPNGADFCPDTLYEQAVGVNKSA